MWMSINGSVDRGFWSLLCGFINWESFPVPFPGQRRGEASAPWRGQHPSRGRQWRQNTRWIWKQNCGKARWRLYNRASVSTSKPKQKSLIRPDLSDQTLIRNESNLWWVFIFQIRLWSVLDPSDLLWSNTFYEEKTVKKRHFSRRFLT